MKKSVLVVYGERKIPISFEEKDPTCSFDDFFAKFSVFVSNDTQFKRKDGLIPIFSYYCEEFQTFVDLYKGCEVPTGIHINLRYYDPKNSPSKAKSKHGELDAIASSSGSINQWESLTGFRSAQTQQANVSQDDICGEYVIEEMLDKSIDMSYEKPSIDADPDFEIESVDFKTLDISPTASPAKKKVKAGDTKRERVIFYPSEIPVFSAEVQEIIKKDHLLFKTGEFVKQSAYFLRSLVEFPTPLEYTAYSRTLVEKYPILAQLPGDHDNNYSALSKLLSVKMRAFRQNDKKPLLKTKRTIIFDKCEAVIEENKKDCDVAGKAKQATLFEGIPVEELLLMLAKPNKDAALVKEILTKTFTIRRSLIEEPTNTLSSILKKWPIFKSEEIILFEASLVLKSKMKLFEENFLPMMTKLGQLTSFKGDIMKSEAAQLRCLEQLHVMLQPKDDGKGYQRAINIAKIGDKHLPKESSVNAPAVWACVSTNKIEAAYIFAEGDEICELSEKSTQNILKMLLSVYYVFHSHYPACSSNFMEFMEYSLMGKTDFKGNTLFNKIKERYLKIKM